MSIEHIKYQISESRNGGFPLEEAVDSIVALSEEERWEVIRREYQNATKAVHAGSPVLFFLVDKTRAGDSHVIRALFSPIFNGLIVEIPQEDQYQSGRFPTVLHALEVVSTVNKLSGNENLPVGLKFLDAEEFNKAQQQISNPEITLVPLIVDPERTNLVIFHTQARKVDPRAIALGYYKILPRLGLEEDLLRHTMLVTPQGPLYRPVSHPHVVVDIWEHRLIGDFFSMLNPGRIKSWNNGNQHNEYYVSFREYQPPEDNFLRSSSYSYTAF